MAVMMTLGTMTSKVQKVGWIGQAVIVSIGSIVGALFALALVPVGANLHDSEHLEHAIWMWSIASCGALAGGLLFSWIQDR